jgi:hypothetical protein
MTSPRSIYCPAYQPIRLATRIKQTAEEGANVADKSSSWREGSCKAAALAAARAASVAGYPAKYYRLQSPVKVVHLYQKFNGGEMVTEILQGT